MPLSIYISSLNGPRGSIVVSKENPVSQAFRDLVLGDVHAANIYLVDGVGGYDARSGQAGSSVRVALGIPGTAPVWINTNWQIISNGWAGQIAANTQSLVALFTDSDPIDVTLEIQITDAAGNSIAFANPKIHIWRRLIDINSLVTNPFMNAVKGEYAIPALVDTGVVSGLALALLPTGIIVQVQKPVGGFNLFPTLVSGSITLDGFSFDLSGQTDSANYKLDYTLLY